MAAREEKDDLWRRYFELVLDNKHRAAFDCLQELADFDPNDPRVHAEISALIVELGDIPLGDPNDEPGSQSEEGEEEIEVVCFDRIPEIFASLPEEDIELLERSGTYRTIGVGETVFREGDMGDSMFIIKSGKALVTVDTGGDPLVVATLEDGDFFGEMALLSRRPRTATVTALGELMVMEIPRDGLKSLVERHPDIPRSLADYFNERAQDSKQKLEQEKSTPSGVDDLQEE